MGETVGPIVQFFGITKRFDPSLPPAINNLNVSFPRGKIVGLVGPDGSGKTTLLRLTAGLLLPSDGKIVVNGYDTVLDPESIHQDIGYMPQKFGLYEDLTVQENLELYARLRGVPAEEKARVFAQLLKFTDLARFVDRLAGALSGGMKQKLGLACALMRKPSLLLLDEPSVGVDPISRRELWHMVRGLLDEGISVVWSTAYLDEAERCDLVLLLDHGKLMYEGVPSDLNQRTEGRVVLVQPPVQGKRRFLSEALKTPGVVDGVIQGSEVRLVMREVIASAQAPAILQGTNFRIVKPRFEDSFVELLGGKSWEESQIAQHIPEVALEPRPVVEAKHLVKRFGSFCAADDISFDIRPGEIFGLLGPNGAGKSTTFKMMCGLLKPTSGDALINGIDLKVDPGEARSQIGYMAQKFSLYGTLSVYQNLRFFSGIYGLQGSVRKERIKKMIEIFELGVYLQQSADMLPLGFKQRLALACSLMHHPRVLFLDEPTSGVDPITRREFWNHINGLVEKGVTVMVTTHFMEEAEYCDRIALVYRGEIIQMGTPDELKAQVKSTENVSPTLEDAFIALIRAHDDAR